MSSEIVLLREYKKDKPALKWCVYYEPDSGDVVTVTNKEKDFIKKPFIVTDSDDARLLLMGHKDPKKFAVVEVNHDLKINVTLTSNLDNNLNNLEKQKEFIKKQIFDLAQ